MLLFWALRMASFLGSGEKMNEEEGDVSVHQ